MSKHWYVLYVKPKNEKKVTDRLIERQIEVYCPMVKEIRQWSDRKKTVKNPLFKSYVFVRLLEKERPIVFDVPGVIRYLFWLGKPAVVRDVEIQAIMEWLSNDRVEEYKLSQLVPGDKVAIQKGMLAHQNAVVQNVGRHRVRLIIEGLGMVVNMKLKDLL